MNFKQMSGPKMREILPDLHVAIRKGYYHEVRMLVSAPSSDLNVRDLDGRSPLMVCSLVEEKAWAIGIARMLLEKGASLTLTDKRGLNSLQYASVYERTDLVKVFLSAVDYDLNHRDARGNTALFYAASTGNLDIVKLLASALKRYGLFLNKTNKRGMTPLMEACRLGHQACSHFLIYECGASTELRDRVYGRNADDWEREYSSNKDVVENWAVNLAIPQLNSGIRPSGHNATRKHLPPHEVTFAIRDDNHDVGTAVSRQKAEDFTGEVFQKAASNGNGINQPTAERPERQHHQIISALKKRASRPMTVAGAGAGGGRQRSGSRSSSGSEGSGSLLYRRPRTAPPGQRLPQTTKSSVDEIKKEIITSKFYPCPPPEQKGPRIPDQPNKELLARRPRSLSLSQQPAPSDHWRNEFRFLFRKYEYQVSQSYRPRASSVASLDGDGGSGTWLADQPPDRFGSGSRISSPVYAPSEGSSSASVSVSVSLK